MIDDEDNRLTRAIHLNSDYKYFKKKKTSPLYTLLETGESEVNPSFEYDKNPLDSSLDQSFSQPQQEFLTTFRDLKGKLLVLISSKKRTKQLKFVFHKLRSHQLSQMNSAKFKSLSQTLDSRSLEPAKYISHDLATKVWHSTQELIRSFEDNSSGQLAFNQSGSMN